MEFTAIAATVGGLLFTDVIAASALAAVFRKHPDTRREAYRVLQLLLRSRHRR